MTLSKEAMERAARCWCEPETSMIEMDTRLATAFAVALDEERARSAKLVEALEKIHGWHWQHNSPAEIKGWADEALEFYRAGDEK